MLNMLVPSILLNLKINPILQTALLGYCTAKAFVDRLVMQSSKMQELDVLYFSDNFIIINKDYDVFINNDDPTKTRSLAKQLCAKYPGLVISSLKHGFYFPHRLDYATSGVICIALNKVSCAAAATAFHTQLTKKYYLALVRGHMKQDKINVSVPVGKDERETGDDGNKRMCVQGPHCLEARSAFTRILVLERGFYESAPATKLLLRLFTGRRHQLRVHCAYLGHTIIGDYTYSNKTDLLPPRMFLHAYRLVNSNTLEPFDVRTEDPFTEKQLQATWIPDQSVHPLNEDTMELLEVHDKGKNPQ